MVFFVVICYGNNWNDINDRILGLPLMFILSKCLFTFPDFFSFIFHSNQFLFILLQSITAYVKLWSEERENSVFLWGSYWYRVFIILLFRKITICVQLSHAYVFLKCHLCSVTLPRMSVWNVEVEVWVLNL